MDGLEPAGRDRRWMDCLPGRIATKSLHCAYLRELRMNISPVELQRRDIHLRLSVWWVIDSPAEMQRRHSRKGIMPGGKAPVTAIFRVFSLYWFLLWEQTCPTSHPTI